MDTKKTVAEAVREHIADKFSDGREFSLASFKNLAKKMHAKNAAISNALDVEIEKKSIVCVGIYKTKGFNKAIRHFKLINISILMRKAGKPVKTEPEPVKYEPPMLQAALDAIVHKRMKKNAVSRARCAA